MYKFKKVSLNLLWPFLLSVGCNADMMAGTQAAILDHEVHCDKNRRAARGLDPWCLYEDISSGPPPLDFFHTKKKLPSYSSSLLSLNIFYLKKILINRLTSGSFPHFIPHIVPFFVVIPSLLYLIFQGNSPLNCIIKKILNKSETVS